MNGSDAAAASAASAAWNEVSPEIREAVYVVIACFNEQGAVGGVVSELRERGLHVVVVDDGSRDESFERAREAGAHVLKHLVNRGQGAALQTGIAFALKKGARFVVTFDADGQHDPNDLPAMLLPIARGEVEICLGSRFLGAAENMPTTRRIMLKGAVIFTRITSGLRLTDAHNGLRAFSRRAAEHLDLQLDRMAHASEIVDQVRTSALPFREIPVHIRYTDYSLAKGQRSTAALRVAMDYLIGRVLR
jgi:glycosyltransferase involved in cell wall biosynthesis